MGTEDGVTGLMDRRARCAGLAMTDNGQAMVGIF